MLAKSAIQVMILYLAKLFDIFFSPLEMMFFSTEHHLCSKKLSQRHNFTATMLGKLFNITAKYHSVYVQYYVYSILQTVSKAYLSSLFTSE